MNGSRRVAVAVAALIGGILPEAVTDATLWWIHGSEPGDWYAVGASGRVLHHTGGARVDESAPTASTLYGVWVAADGDVWAVGGDVRDTGRGEVWRRHAGVWSAFATDLPGVVFKVWDRWFVGVGHRWHLEGDALVEVPIPEDLRLSTVRGRADDDVYAAGGFAGPALLPAAARVGPAGRPPVCELTPRGGSPPRPFPRRERARGPRGGPGRVRRVREGYRVQSCICSTE